MSHLPEHIRKVNRERVGRWHGPDDDWTLGDWSNATAGEMGELWNVVKKIRRVQSGFVYHYAFMMIIGVFVLLTLWIAGA